MSEQQAQAVDAAERIQKLEEFIDSWAEVIQGGDRIDSLKGWSREFVEEARKILRNK